MSSDKEILALEDTRYAAMCDGDLAALETMLHDELLYTHSSGLTDTKATWLASLRSGKTKYKSAACSDRKVRLVGDTALVTGRAAIEAEINGQPRSLRLVFLNAWTKTPKGWKFIARRRRSPPVSNGRPTGARSLRCSPEPRANRMNERGIPCPVSAAHVRTLVEFCGKEEDMPRIVHIAIKVDDLEKATKFYEDVFGFRQTGTGYARGHVSRHLTDGNIDLALMVYDSEDVEEAGA
jgi:ketosteroid isomerase-like protein